MIAVNFDLYEQATALTDRLLCQGTTARSGDRRLSRLFAMSRKREDRRLRKMTLTAWAFAGLFLTPEAFRQGAPSPYGEYKISYHNIFYAKGVNRES